MGKMLWILLTLAALSAAAYFITPAFIVTEADDPSPLERAVAHLSEEEQALLEQQMREAAAERTEMEEEMPTAPELLAEGALQAGAHDVTGAVRLIDTAEGRILRFEEFATINGPELHIYLSADTRAEEYTDLGRIRATKGNVNYPIPSEWELERQPYVLVWCEPFGVLFSYALLT